MEQGKHDTCRTSNKNCTEKQQLRWHGMVKDMNETDTAQCPDQHDTLKRDIDNTASLREQTTKCYNK